MDQVNRAVAEMEKVAQRTAASAEESAAASEEMSAKAKQMRSLVGELVILVEGRRNRKEIAARSAIVAGERR